MEFLRSWNEVT